MSNEVEKLLREKGIPFTISGNDYVTKCMNPEHDDQSPSFRIDKVKGIAHCFSCGFKINIFKYYGIITNQVNIKVAGIKEKLKALKQGTEGLEMLEGHTPITEIFRGISVKTLSKFDVFYTDKVPTMEDRVIIPLKDIKGRIKVFIGRHSLSKANPRYMIYPKGITLPLFPVMLMEKSKSLVLVEGIFDMLNLYDKGLHNVVATMGTNTLNNDGARNKMLPFKAQGVEKIFILFDGDTAGIEAAKELKPRLEAYGFEVEIIDLPEGSDPGEMSLEYVEGLKAYISS